MDVTPQVMWAFLNDAGTERQSDVAEYSQTTFSKSAGIEVTLTFTHLVDRLVTFCSPPQSPLFTLLSPPFTDPRSTSSQHSPCVSLWL